MENYFRSWEKEGMKQTTFTMAFLVFFFAGCSHLTELKESPKVTLHEVQVKNAGLTEAELNVQLNVENPNKVEVMVKNLKYSIDLNNKHLTSGNIAEEIKIAAGAQKILTVPLKVKYSDVVSSALKFFDDKGLPFHVEGSVDIGPFNVPFSEKGTLKASEMK